MSDAVSTLHALPLVCCRGAALHHQPTRVAQIIPAVVTNHARNFGADGIQPLLDSLPTRNATTAIVEAVLAKYHPGAEFGVTSQHTSNSTGLTHVYASATSPRRLLFLYSRASSDGSYVRQRFAQLLVANANANVRDRTPNLRA